MLKHLRPFLLALACLVAPHAGAAEPREIDWLEMIPPDELAELEKMADVEIDHNSEIPAEPIGSSRPVMTMDGTQGRLPGYIVPLNSDEKNRVTEFFLVPYYGACIHVPPPPGNQIVWVKPAEPVADVEIWNPYWIEGTLHVRSRENDVAAASYSFEAQRVYPYM